MRPNNLAAHRASFCVRNSLESFTALHCAPSSSILLFRNGVYLGNFEWHVFMVHHPIFLSLCFRQFKWARKFIHKYAHEHRTHCRTTIHKKTEINKNENAFTGYRTHHIIKVECVHSTHTHGRIEASEVDKETEVQKEKK